MNRNAFEYFVKIYLNNKNLNNLSYIKQLTNDNNDFLIYRLYDNKIINDLVINNELDGIKIKYKYNKRCFSDIFSIVEEDGKEKIVIPSNNIFFVNTAIEYGHLQILKWFHNLEKKIHCNPHFSAREYFLDDAVQYGHLNIIKWLLKLKNNDPYHCAEKFEIMYIYMAIKHGDLNIIKWITKLDRDNPFYPVNPKIFDHFRYLIDEATKHGKLHIVKWLCKNRNDKFTVELLHFHRGQFDTINGQQNTIDCLKYIDKIYGINSIIPLTEIKMAVNDAIDLNYHLIAVYLIEYIASIQKK